MFTLVSERRKYFRVKRGQSREDIELALCTPVGGEAFSGRIVEAENSFTVYTAKPGDSYGTVAINFGASESELKKINGDRAVYPTRRLFVPKNPTDGIL